MKKILYCLFFLSSFTNISEAFEEYLNAERKAMHTRCWETLRVNPKTFTKQMDKKTPFLQIGVADTGFNVYHPMLNPSVGLGINGRDGNRHVLPSVVCDPTRPDYGKVTTHGTDVAGICALMNPVVIVPGKLGACGNSPMYSLNEVLKTFARAKEIRIVNISGFGWAYCFEAIFKLAWAGKMVVIAGGNDNQPLPDIILSNGRKLSENLQQLNGRVLFVGATKKENDGVERRAWYSNWPCPSLAPYFISAPGTIDTITEKNAEGTSFAAPVFVSAMVRLSLEFGITLESARDVIFSTAIKKNNEHFNAENTGIGIVNFMEAWNQQKSLQEIEVLRLKQDAEAKYCEFVSRRQDAEKRLYETEQQIRNIEIYISQLIPYNLDAKITELQIKAFHNGKAAVLEKLRSMKESEFTDKDALVQDLKDIWVSHEREAAQELREYIEACRQTNNSLLLATLDKVKLWKSVCNLRSEASHYSNQEFTAFLKLDDQSQLSKCKDALTATLYHFQMSQSARNWERYEYGRACAVHRYADYLNGMFQDWAFIEGCVSMKNEQQRDQTISEMIFKARFNDLINEKAPNLKKSDASQYGA